ncbi:MAG: BrnA antitoxin family protein [Rhizobiaceae bacterium]
MSISAKRLAELSARAESEPDYSDIPPLDDNFWSEARVVLPKGPKQQLTIRFDADLVEWFRSKGKGYQSRMNDVLRAYMDAHR